MLSEHRTILNRIFNWRYLFIVNFFIFLFIAVFFGREFIRDREIDRDISLLQTKANELSARNLQITELSTSFQTESYIEREARLKLGLKKNGEKVVVIKNNAQEDGFFLDNVDNLDKIKKIEVDNPTKWWYYFFQHDKYKKIN